MKILTKTQKLTKAAIRKFDQAVVALDAQKAYATISPKEMEMPQTTDVVVGDYVAWFEPVFTGSFRNAKLAGYSWNAGRILRDSYGAQSGQHTFTIKTHNGFEIRKKGRTIFNIGCFLIEEAIDHNEKAEEKHQRGNEAKKSALAGWLLSHDPSHPRWNDKAHRAENLGINISIY